ncbi:hypothetical protein SETIT_3G329300v2 [Setaria italica]|uniref:Uncharacterized protein n=2 Tax=Setaria TaxID=4554 RepID=A0A368QLA9_SETIT|nr:hypothetical protein SETIT_3G329300v2 [Setaria italica]TKW28656.1 hypothetical protein SEVIR_3G343000v2 [Setaria viridis]
MRSQANFRNEYTNRDCDKLTMVTSNVTMRQMTLVTERTENKDSLTN